MANKRICVQIDFNGPNPIITRSSFAVDRRLTLRNIWKLLMGVDKGSQFRRPPGTTTVVVQDTLVQASATATAAAVQAADTVSIGGQALTATQRRATGTLTAASAIAGDTFVINGQTFTGVSGAATLGDATFSIDTGDNETAASIVAQVNAYAGAKVSGVLGARAAAAVVTIYSVMQGTAGNSLTLLGTAVRLAASAATLLNGTAIANNTFDWAGSNDTTAAALAYAINNSTTAAVKQTSATAAAAVVTVTAKPPGKAGNTIAFVSSNGSRLAVTGSGFLASGSAGNPTEWAF